MFQNAVERKAPKFTLKQGAVRFFNGSLRLKKPLTHLTWFAEGRQIDQYDV